MPQNGLAGPWRISGEPNVGGKHSCKEGGQNRNDQKKGR